MTAAHRHPTNRKSPGRTGANNPPKLPAWKDREPGSGIPGGLKIGHTLAEIRRISRRAREAAQKHMQEVAARKAAAAEKRRATLARKKADSGAA